MQYRRLLAAIPVIAAVSLPPVTAQEAAQASAAQDSPTIVFRSSVDIVSVTAVVRDRKGKVVPSLTTGDFEVLDEGRQRPILDLFSEETAPASVALLVDGSGSMRLGAANDASRQIATAVLGSLNARRDDAALLSVDTRLITLQNFTHDFDTVRQALQDIESFGSTSLFDAIAGTAGLVADRTRNRRAVVVLTDGADTSSAYTPERVSSIASTIDVPVYVFALGDQPEPTREKHAPLTPARQLANLAHATGGDYFVANTPALVNASIVRMIEELRHQYVIGFEAANGGGLRRVEVRTRKSDLLVRSRKWYASGAGE